uniref:GTPase IMAP family member 8-like n=1 Tax=Sparus aurata TaxID=8175 RepID=A0A671UHV7_SPAAU
MATAVTVTDDLQPLKRSSSYSLLPPSMSELRAVLLGNSWSERRSVGNFILGKTEYNTEEESDSCLTTKGQLKETNILLTNTPDLLHPNISEDKLKKHVEHCVSLCDPGPHVFLLVLQPEDFTGDHKLRLCRILNLFGHRSFDHSLVLMSPRREESSGSKANNVPEQPLKDMKRMCRYRYLNQENLELPELLTRLGQIVKENNGEHVNSDVSKGQDTGLIMSLKSESEHIKPALNLVLCGRRGAGKTSAVRAILGQTDRPSASNSSECVKHQGEVCGRQVSLVELPALYGKPTEVVMAESFKSISLCDPEGVHAFILVLPLDSLTDEDKGELETIRNTFSSQVNDFTMILFTVESELKSPDVVLKENKDIQELCQSYGGRYTVLKIREKQQIPELFDDVKKMRALKSRHFTKDMFTTVQIKKVVEKEKTNGRLQAELQDVKEKSVIAGVNDESQSRDCLRMVLIGKSDSSRSATGNAVLGREHFKSSQEAVAKVCQKAAGKIDGQPVTVVDIPALFDMTLSDDDIQQQINMCFRMLSPGPHVFLLVLKKGYCKQEETDTVELTKKYFGKKSEDFIITIFTGGDEPDDQSFVKQPITYCRRRYQVFSNRADTSHTDVRELLSTVRTMVKENGGCYNTELWRVEKILKERTGELKRKDEEVRTLNEELKTQKRTIKELQGETEQEKNLRAKQLKEKDDCIKKEREERKREQEEGERRRKKQEEIQRQEIKRRQVASEKLVQKEREQTESAVKRLEQYRKEVNREREREREAWEKERKDMWEQMRQEDKQSLEKLEKNNRKLQEMYKCRRRTFTAVTFVLSLFILFLLCYVLLH